jgi:hypothetical protein
MIMKVIEPSKARLALDRPNTEIVCSNPAVVIGFIRCVFSLFLLYFLGIGFSLVRSLI